MAGELDGTSVFLEVFNTDTGLWAPMAGELNSAPTLTNGLILITNKQSNSFVTILAGKGRQAIQLVGDWVFNSDADFQFVRDAANDKASVLLRILRGPVATGKIDQFNAIVGNVGDSSPDGDKITSAFTFQTTGELELLYTLEAIQNSGAENVQNAGAEQIYSRSAP